MWGEEEAVELCRGCGKLPATSTSILCGPCSKKTAGPPRGDLDIEVIRGHQASFGAVMDGFISIYRDLDKTRRPDIKIQMKKVYEDIQILGTRLGISRSSMDHIWKG